MTVGHDPSRYTALNLEMCSLVWRTPELCHQVSLDDMIEPYKGMVQWVADRVAKQQGIDLKALTAHYQLDHPEMSRQMLAVIDRYALPEDFGRIATELRTEAVLRWAEHALKNRDLDLLRRCVEHRDQGHQSGLKKASDVTLRPLTWLWQHRIPFGAITILAGTWGIGKSVLTMDIAAAVSQGRGLMGDTGGAPANVLIVATEDDPETTGLPRLMASGADLTRVTFWDWHTPGNDLVLPKNADKLRAAIKKTGARLVILDPVAELAGAGASMNDSNAIRAVMRPLTQISSDTGCAILCVAHPPKDRSNGSFVAGAGAWEQVARSVLTYVRSPLEDATPRDRVIIQAKSNWAEDVDHVLCRVVPSDYSPDIPCIGWVRMVDKDEVDARAVASDEIVTAAEIDEAIRFLERELAEGGVPAGTVFKHADDIGVARAAVKIARARLGALAEKSTTQSGNVQWMFMLEEHTGAPPAAAARADRPGYELVEVIPELPNHLVGEQDEIMRRCQLAYRATRWAKHGRGKYEFNNATREALIAAVAVTEDPELVVRALQGWRFDDWEDRPRYCEVRQLIGSKKKVKLGQLKRLAGYQPDDQRSPLDAILLVQGMEDTWKSFGWTDPVRATYTRAILDATMDPIEVLAAHADSPNPPDPAAFDQFSLI